MHEITQLWQGVAKSLAAELARVEERLIELKGYGLLTPTETKVLRLFAHGLTRRQVMARLGIARGTINKHEMNIYKKLGVRDRTNAALWAWRNGVVSIDEAWATVEQMQGRQ